MPWDLLVLPLLGGYWATQRFRLTRFRAQQIESYRLLIESAIVGLLLVGGAKILWLAPDCPVAIEALLFGNPMKPALRCLRDCLLSPLSAETAVTSALLGGLLPEIGNWIVSPVKAIRWNYGKFGDSLYALLYEAFYAERRVSLTLDTRKVYVGVVVQLPDLERSDDFVRILPLDSGYRDSESLALTLHTSYRELYQRIAQEEDGRLDGLTADHFEIVVSIKSIKTANLFSEGVYNEVFAIPPETEPGVDNEVFAHPPETERGLLAMLLTTLANWFDQPKNTA